MNKVIANLSSELRTQDNAATAHPLFLVQQKVIRYGAELGYCDGAHWWDGVDWETVMPASEARSYVFESLSPQPPSADMVDLNEQGWEQVGYFESWRYVTAHLTRRAAEGYIDENRHNLREPRVYVGSQYRCWEFNDTVEYLRGLYTGECL